MLCCNKTAVGGCCQDTGQSRQDKVAGLGNAEYIHKSYDIKTYAFDAWFESSSGGCVDLNTREQTFNQRHARWCWLRCCGGLGP